MSETIEPLVSTARAPRPRRQAEEVGCENEVDADGEQNAAIVVIVIATSPGLVSRMNPTFLF